MKVTEIIENEVLLLDLEPTRYSLLVNKWDLYRNLLDGNLKRIHFEVEDFDNMTKQKMTELAKGLINE